MRGHVRGQDGFTLVEVVIALAISVVVMGALTSVIFTSVRATDVASSRVEASGQIRNFQLFAYDDFARSQVPGGGCSQASPCTTLPIVLSGTQVNNSTQPTPGPLQVTYTWDGTQFLDRQIGSVSTHAATDVSAFSWYVDSSGPYPTVVVSMTITINDFSQSQTFVFYPRLNP